jgi:hypothetical protein
MCVSGNNTVVFRGRGVDLQKREITTDQTDPLDFFKQTFSDVIIDLFVSTRTKQYFVVFEVIYDLLFN